MLKLLLSPGLGQETEVTSTSTRPVDNVVIAMKGLQDRNINILAGTMVENKGRKFMLLLTSVSKVKLNFRCSLLMCWCNCLVCLLLPLYVDNRHKKRITFAG